MKQSYIKRIELENAAMEVYCRWKGIKFEPIILRVDKKTPKIGRVVEEFYSIGPKTCLLCKRSRVLTRDHIIPKWLLVQTHIFGLNGVKIPKNNYRMICSDCNRSKGGTIDYSIPMVKEFMIDLANEILKKCK